jgi:hypothetical protein
MKKIKAAVSGEANPQRNPARGLSRRELFNVVVCLGFKKAKPLKKKSPRKYQWSREP